MTFAAIAASSLALLVLLAGFVSIRLNARFSLDTTRQILWQARLLLWQWQGIWPDPNPDRAPGPRSRSSTVSPIPGSDSASPSAPASSGSTTVPTPPASAKGQGGFIRLPAWFDLWRQRLKSPALLRAWLRATLQRTAFMLITDAQLWSQSGRALRRLPLRMAKALHLRLAHLELAHPQPETLGQWAAWHAGIGYALGRPLPLQLHFEERQMRVAGEITARANLWDLIWLLMASLYDLPWRPVLRAFRLGFTHSRLPGWREKGLSLILAIFRHHG